MSHEKPAWYLMKKPSKNINVHEYENIAERKNWSRRLQQFFRSFFCYTAILAAFLEFFQSIALRALPMDQEKDSATILNGSDLYAFICPQSCFYLYLQKNCNKKRAKLQQFPASL